MENLPDDADQVIDANGRHVTPGFIDCHSHGDFIFGAGDYAERCKINQGITTQLTGQCWDTYAPANKARDNATYAEPTELAGGIDAVFVNGVLVYENGELIGATPGTLIV